MSRGDVSQRRHTMTPLCDVWAVLGRPVRSGVATLANEPWRWCHRITCAVGQCLGLFYSVAVIPFLLCPMPLFL